MIEFEAQLFGDEEFVKRLYGYPRALRARIAQAVGAAARQFARDVSSSPELNGNPIKSVTGKLRSSMVVKTTDKDDFISAAVWPKAKYGWKLGLGTPKNEVNVRAHPRFYAGAGNISVVSTVMKKTVGRGSRYYRVRKAIFAKSSIPVKSHVRKMILAKAAKPFMGPTYDRMRSAIEQRIKFAVVQAQQDMLAGQNIEEPRGRS